MERSMRWLTLGLLAVGGCSTISTNASFAPGANPAEYHTFAWAPQPAGHVESPGEQQVRAALQRDLASKGIVPATTGAPDMLVAYHARKQQQIEGAPGYGWYGWPDIYTYTEGTLIVDFVDPRTNRVFWRGTASGALDHPDNPNIAMIDQAVDKLMQSYPASMAASAPPPQM